MNNTRSIKGPKNMKSIKGTKNIKYIKGSKNIKSIKGTKNIKSIKGTKNIKSPSHINIYLRIVPRIAFYLKNKNISVIFKYKCPLFAAGDKKGRIYLFSNSLEHMSTFSGYLNGICSLCAISNKILASGSHDKNIKIWDIENRAIISTLSGHSEGVTVLCRLEGGQFVSGSDDNSLIIWSKFPGLSSTYSHKQVLIGHRSYIEGIIRINNREIISGEYHGNLKIWNIDQGVCIRHISSMGYGLHKMKQHIGGDVAISYYFKKEIFVLGAVNNWEAPIKLFRVCAGCSIEFLDRDILLRGKANGELEFIDYSQTGCSMPPNIRGLYSDFIIAIQRIAKNILITAPLDGSLKVIHPLSRKCYLKFKKGNNMKAIVYFH